MPVTEWRSLPLTQDEVDAQAAAQTEFRRILRLAIDHFKSQQKDDRSVMPKLHRLDRFHRQLLIPHKEPLQHLARIQQHLDDDGIDEVVRGGPRDRP